MWIIIILAIVCFILYKFFSDREEMLNRTQSEGGMQNKYRTLLSYILVDPGSKITKVTRDIIVVNWKAGFSSAQISILQLFDVVKIKWVSNNSAGSINTSWEFPDSMDQNTMADRIMRDIERKIVLDTDSSHGKVLGDCKIKLGKVLDQVPMGRFTMTKIEATLLDEEGNEVAKAPLLTSLPLDDIEVDENFVVTNAFLSAPDKDGNSWLVKSGEDSGDSKYNEYNYDIDEYPEDYDEDFDDGKFGTK